MIDADELIKKMKDYDSNVNEDLIRKAYNFSKKHHSTQIRESGDPYFTHPLSVAQILIDMKMDQYTVCTGLLHDIVEDTTIGSDEIKKEFGDVIENLVDGVTKLSKIKFKSKTQKQADNFKKFVMAVASDIRVLIVKLADRLHNIRTIQYVSSDERKQRIATETLEMYAPLAERIGMQNLLEELQDICFKVLYKKERSAIKQKLIVDDKRSSDIKSIIKSLNVALSRKDIVASITGRMKTPFSIWKKMHKHNISFDQLTDIMAFRVIVSDVNECYKALCVIHTSYQALPGKFKDYISTPKVNNYRALHTSVFGPLNQKIEIQIKTHKMHEVAETGIAAHWSYKENLTNNSDPYFSKYKWIRNLVTVIDNNSRSSGVMEDTKAEMIDNEIFCFTPQGEIIDLPNGATCLDMAYAIHTFIGNTCMKAKVNGSMMPLDTVLNNGDKVEIITAPHQAPSKEWIAFAVTGKAKACIKKYVQLKERAEYVALGHSLVKQIIGECGNVVDEVYIAEKLQETFKCKSRNSFYMKFGRGLINLQNVRDSIKILTDIDPIRDIKKTVLKKRSNAIFLDSQSKEYVLHYANCCSPIPGDEVIGVLKKNEGVIVHRSNCDALDMLDNKTFISVEWSNNIAEFFISKVKVVVLNQPGSIVQVAGIISSYGVNINNLTTIPYNSQEFLTIEIAVEVNNVDVLEKICAGLRTNIRVKNVTRA